MDRAFNSVLSTACLLDEIETGVACMGIIEQAFAGISAAIGQAVTGRGWAGDGPGMGRGWAGDGPGMGCPR